MIHLVLIDFQLQNTKLVIQLKIFQDLKAKRTELTKNKKVMQRENALIENIFYKKNSKKVFFSRRSVSTIRRHIHGRNESAGIGRFNSSREAHKL